MPDRSPRRRRASARAVPASVACAAILASAALCGCGGDSGSTQDSTAGNGSLSSGATGAGPAKKTGTTSSGGGLESQLPPQARVDLAIKSVLASGVPDLACTQYSTERYVKTTFGGRGGCIKSTLPASAAQTIDEKKIEIKPHKATATIVAHGGPSDGETIKVTLVRQGDVWKVDTLKSNAPVGP